MTIILDNQTLPEKGHLEFTVSVDIAITAKEAHYKVRWWLRDNISMFADADPPEFVVGEKCVWRVPVYVAYATSPKYSNIGVVNVDATTGEMLDLDNAKKAITEHIEKKIVPYLPPFKPRTRESIPDKFIPKDIPPAPMLKIPEDTDS